MGLSDALVRAAASSAHVLPVEVPGHWRTRAAVEREVLQRGWSLALSPADADVLVVCGHSGPELSEAVDVVWQQMPGPRVRVDVDGASRSRAGLDEARAALLDTAAHQHDASNRPPGPALLEDDEQEEGHEGMDHGDHDDGEGGHHGDMETAPGGIPLAGGGDDRDGLEMDVLHVRFGPVLRHWPAGLSLRCVLQGDVVTEARAQLVDEAADQDDDARPAARLVDRIASLLAVAGWDDGAGEARSVRDAVLDDEDDGDDGQTQLERLRRLHQRVRRSVVLRWALRGVRPLSEAELAEHDLPALLAGDTFDRLVRMFEDAEASMAEQPQAGRPMTVSTDQLARLVTGLDVATARLVVASLGAAQLQVAGRREAEHA